MLSQTDRLRELFVRHTDTVRDAMACLDRGAKGIVLLVDKDERLVTTITDGDMRRAIMRGIRLDADVNTLVAQKLQNGGRDKPVVASHGTTRDELMRILKETGVSQLPVVDQNGTIRQLWTLNQFVPDSTFPVQAVIMAGGFGSRLSPLTDETPKPMLRVAGKPIIERTIERLSQAGIHRINITTHYLPDKIKQHLGSGEQLGVDLTYVSEDQPLGTAGSLGLVEDCNDPLLVMNGDILTRVDFRALLSFHQDQGADLTVGVRQYDIEVPYGVIEAHNGRVRRLREKPKVGFLVNAGIYLLEPSVRDLIPSGQRYDMTDLIERLLEENLHVSSFPVLEYWIDIGQHDDFRRAQKDFDETRWAA